MTKVSFALAVLCAATSAVAQDRGTIIVLDGSGSMWAQLPEGRSRIEVARDVLDDFLTARDPAQPLGVIAYGHNRRGDCSDIETIATVGIQDGRDLGERLRGLMPRGRTPLADALRRAAAEIPLTAEEADIVLVTDGLETCGGDPCAVAAELAAQGISVRAHVVGFGLTEAEIGQIACVAEQTGGMVLATQSGAELSDALLRTASAPVAAPDQPGVAAIALSIRADIAGRPDRVAFRAANDATGEALDLGVLDFANAGALTVELSEGNWLITADAGDQGNGEITVVIEAGDNRAIHVPFRGLLPGLDMPAPTGAFRAGINGLIPYRITQEGLATGGGDFIFSLLPLDAANTTDRRIEYATQDSRLGSHVGAFRTPAEPGDYLLVFHRNASMPIDEVMERFVITVEPRPEMRLIAPPAVEPGARVPVSITGGMGNSDRIEIWRDGALLSWDQSIYLQDFFDNRYGPAQPLLAPTEPGDYELVYVFSEIDGPEAVAARVPLTVGAVPEPDEAPLTAPVDAADLAPAEPADGHGPDDQTDGRPWSTYPYRCLPDDRPEGLCEFTDEATGLSMYLPDNWVAEVTPGPDGPRADFFEVTGAARSAHLNPADWPAPDQGCFATRAGALCVSTEAIDTGFEEPLAILQRYLRTGEVLRNCGREPCDYLLPWRGFMGALPAFWGVEIPQENNQGILTGWFYGNFGSDPVKIIGLNQPGGEACVEAFEGAELCVFTPYISTQEMEAIRSTLRIAPPPPPPGAMGTPAGRVDYQDIDSVLSIIEGN